MYGTVHNLWPTAAALSVAALFVLPSCTFIEFEPSPYQPRGVDIVYSQQEDITFFVWRVGDVVDFDRVDFELLVDGDYRPVDTEETIFPHAPYECDRNYYCLQFQLDGNRIPAGDAPVVRAHDDLHGTLESPEAREHQVETTFSIDPLATDNNRRATAQRTDWFDDEEIPLRRQWQWGLIESDGGECTIGSPDGWSTLRPRVELPQNWINSTPCFALRPHRSDGGGTVVVDRLIESPMLFGEDFDETIPSEKHPVHLAFLVNLEVTNEARCEQYIDSIRSEIFDSLDELEDHEEYPRTAGYEDLGIYRPVDNTGEEQSGCTQDTDHVYPVEDIITDADEATAGSTEISTLVVVYLNNLDLPPAQSNIERLAPLFEDRPEDADPHYYGWAIGSHTVLSIFPWNETTPWAPLEDENFLPAIETDVQRQFPLRSTDFDGDDTMTVHAPNASDDPQHVRLCTISPQPQRVALPPGEPGPYDTDTWAWPDDRSPKLFFDIPPQRFVRYPDFNEYRITGAYEVCDQYCDHPFIASDGQVHDSWVDAEGACRWD